MVLGAKVMDPDDCFYQLLDPITHFILASIGGVWGYALSDHREICNNFTLFEGMNSFYINKI